ncbi:hypothetical protein Vadar_001936 [Vaccinium darrowii]|nr:hypothetical protein Vadar_001936 [Vaccinium darrowii]
MWFSQVSCLLNNKNAGNLDQMGSDVPCQISGLLADNTEEKIREVIVHLRVWLTLPVILEGFFLGNTSLSRDIDDGSDVRDPKCLEVIVHLRVWLTLPEFSLAGGRYQRCLKEIRSRACDYVDEEKGIKITKKEWENLHVHIASYNNFPTAAGLASSAAGFACLVFALAKLMNVKDDLELLSSIARQGSGSACRSLYGGFAKWIMGKNEDGSDSVAVQLADEKHWDDLVIVIAVVSSRQKETSSTTGMRETVETSMLIQHRAKVCFGQLNSQFHLIIYVIGDKSILQDVGVKDIKDVEALPPPPEISDKVPAQQYRGCQLLHLHQTRESYVIGDKSILQDAGVKDIKDVEALPPPPEISDKVPAQQYRGDVSYFICTRPGKGPVLLSDESKALLNPETGYPN